jgi:hypothetical protein
MDILSNLKYAVNESEEEKGPVMAEQPQEV